MAAEAKTVTATGTISPKVFYPLVVVVVLTFVGTFLAALTPDTLAALGPFAVPFSLSLAAIAQVIAGYLKSDQLRDLGVDATAAVLPVYDQVTPPPAAPFGDVVAGPVDPEDDVPAGTGAHRADVSLSDEVAAVRGGVK